MLKLFFGIILFYFCLSASTIEYATNNSIQFSSQIPEQNIFQLNQIVPATPVKNENWNEYNVLSGNNFLNNYYITPPRIKKKNL